eukprot:scaffold13678_cov64-Phaeocystis_antarctica.AAC.7
MADKSLAEQALECPVCLTLPEGEVHQCNEGHCYCVSCWNRLEEPRRCPECRQPVPQACRSRVAERAIAALEWSCEHCGEATTRGAKAAHLAACPQVPTACAAAAAGCGWAGMLSEQAAHDSACPFAICQRMVAPLQVECQELRARVAVIEPLQARCDGLQTQNQQLQRQVAALQPLVGRVRALEGVETEEGGRRQRQRVGPAPHDAPPSEDAIAEMGLTEAVAALRAHMAVARVAEKACERLATLSLPVRAEPAAAAAGAIEAVVEAMQAHPQCSTVLSQVLSVLHSVCLGADAAGRARAQRAAGAGGIEEVVAAMRAHAQDRSLQALGVMALIALCKGDDAAGRARKQRASVAGALEAVVEAMRAHPRRMQDFGCEALLSVCGGGASAAARARRQRAAQAGGRTVAAAAMQAHPGDGDVQRRGQLVLNALPVEHFR